MATENIHWKLVLNYDQVWRLKYRGTTAKLYKPASKAGKVKSRFDGRPGLRRAAKRIRLRQKTTASSIHPPPLVDGSDEDYDLDDDDVIDDADADSLDEESDTEMTKQMARAARWAGEIRGEMISMDPIKDQRLPHTVCTSLWGDGAQGPAERQRAISREHEPPSD